MMEMELTRRKILTKLGEIEDMIRDVKMMIKELGAESKDKEDSSEEKVQEAAKTGGRLACPKCGSVNFTKHEDKSKVLYYHQGTPIYAKKAVCNQCGEEFPI